MLTVLDAILAANTVKNLGSMYQESCAVDMQLHFELKDLPAREQSAQRTLLLKDREGLVKRFQARQDAKHAAMQKARWERMSPFERGLQYVMIAFMAVATLLVGTLIVGCLYYFMKFLMGVQ